MLSQVESVESRGITLQAPSAQAALLNLHRALAFKELWESLQHLFETIVPHDTLVMSVNYLDWRRETSTRRFSSAQSRHPHDEQANQLVADEGRAFFQPFLDHHQQIPVYRHSQIESDPRKIQRTGYYQRYMARYDWRYSAHLLFWHGHGVETSFALRRRAEQGDFTPAEMDVLNGVHPHIGVAFDRMRTFEQERQRRRLLEGFYRAKPEAVLFLNWNFEPIYASQDALALCAIWNFGQEQARSYSPTAVFRIPAEIQAACDELKFLWQQRPATSRSAAEKFPPKLVASALPGHEALVALRPEKGGTLTKPVFIIRLRSQAAADPGEAESPDPAHDRLLHQLTPAERELAALVCAGLTNKEIAAQLNKTEGSIKVQLSGIYHKLRVNSRAKLIVALH